MWRWRQFLNLFFEARCPLCQRSTSDSVCSYCWAKLKQCQLPISQAFDKAPIPVVSWGEYSGDLRRAIATFKYENQPSLGYPLGKALGERWKALAGISPYIQLTLTPVIAVPIPMHPAKLKKRGFNQAEIIAEAFCATTNMSLERAGLRRIRETEAQFSLSVHEREKNLADAFLPNPQWKRRSPKANILLIDDIYTTGATVKAASQALHSAGFNVVGVAVVARPFQYCDRTKTD